MSSVKLPPATALGAFRSLKAVRETGPLSIDKVNIEGTAILQWITDFELHFIRNEEMASDVLAAMREHLKQQDGNLINEGS